MYAIIDEGGKQFKVTAGDRIRIDRAIAENEKTIRFDRVLMIGGTGDARIGQPAITGASVTADVLGAVKGKKIDIIKYKRRKGYHRHLGHRQQYTEVRITGIEA